MLPLFFLRVVGPLENIRFSRVCLKYDVPACNISVIGQEKERCGLSASRKMSLNVTF